MSAAGPGAASRRCSRGLRAEGCDPSAAMLREARAALGPDVPLEVAALPHLPDRAPVDLITAMNDVVNCLSPDDLDAAFVALAARLRRGGLLLFDANTRRTYDDFFGSTFCRSDDERFFVWESLPREPDSALHRAELHAFTREADRPDRWIRSVSQHVQHHHPHAQIAAALDAAGLRAAPPPRPARRRPARRRLRRDGPHQADLPRTPSMTHEAERRTLHAQDHEDRGADAAGVGAHEGLLSG